MCYDNRDLKEIYYLTELSSYFHYMAPLVFIFYLLSFSDNGVNP
jgi:hypothetical protein